LATFGLAIPTAADAKVKRLTTCRNDPILSPGTYRLEANIATSKRCFFLDASGITLDLNGHAITSANEKAVGIMAFAGGAKIVGPGTISGFGYAISLVNKGNDTVHGVTTIANQFGIGINSKGNRVRGNVTTNNFTAGIDVFPGAHDNKIERNFAYENGHAGDLRDNNIHDCADNVWRDNDFGTANQSCIH
jgi:hypothetical protein